MRRHKQNAIALVHIAIMRADLQRRQHKHYKLSTVMAAAQVMKRLRKSPSMIVVNPADYDRLLEAIKTNPGSIIPTTHIGTIIGVDIASSPLLDHGTIVTARKRSDGSMEILSVEHLNVHA